MRMVEQIYIDGAFVTPHGTKMFLQTGRVVINGAPHDPPAPFAGYKQSGIGREYGIFGLEAFLEAKAILGVTGHALT
jgi:acyl-CoA reductase-like NAD-dependent aldehyde dehydrogenase